MIGQNLKDNEEKKPNSREMNKLKDNFPQFFSKDGEFKMDAFKSFLSDEEIDISKEGYELKFLGKSYAKYQSSLETETYISPDSKHNEKSENKDSENLYIVGDNIDALKHLLSSYSGKIKCIYIDPPYNTGTDGFVYPDNFQFKASELSDKIGITEEEAERILELAGKSTHSAWLTFMYPRLTLARDLLSDDGVIFISIDDNEQSNLKLMCDEIFGEENHIENLIWKRRATPPNDRIIGKNHEYIYLYSKNNESYTLNLQRRTAQMNSNYKNPDNDPRGDWDYADLSGNGKGGRLVESCIYPIKDPITGKNNMPPKNKCWLYNQDKMNQLMEDNRIVFRGKNRTPYQKKFLKDVRNGATLPTIIEDINVDYSIDISEAGTSQNSAKEIKELFDEDIFEFPKPVTLIDKLLTSGANATSIVLDFFSGSATTADAVMQLNAEDGGNRKYIMVQLPEIIEENKPAYKAGYRTIDEIGRARIEKAAEKIKEETGADIDYGYKLYYLEKPSEKTLVDLENFEPEIKFINDDMISIFDNDHSKGKESILATWLNEDGYGLSKISKTYKLENYKADLIEKTLYIINQGLSQDDVMTLIKRIENEELNITRLVIYVHSVSFNLLHELRKNLKVLRNNKNVTLIERFWLWVLNFQFYLIKRIF